MSVWLGVHCLVIAIAIGIYILLQLQSIYILQVPSFASSFVFVLVSLRVPLELLLDRSCILQLFQLQSTHFIPSVLLAYR